jgi:hypothetical protein
VIAKDTVPGDPPAETLTLGVVALIVMVEAGGVVLPLTLLLAEPEPPHPTKTKVQKRATGARTLQPGR